ncbi:hypothetical protein EAX61_08040 [Dokdonia sinensis]|uniref:Uncharacterized protein n=1 Tax=Dokdonia sinensis TaxID=2479847 RepID=A0A3M0G3L9_9FLAO|nr:hypothetical protein [Dokdonia sinensis]RMB59524.1 hypothetical protein EAX61_08040 [Dokdonia sinensis]
MKFLNFVKLVVPKIPALVSGLLCLAILYGLYFYLPPDYIDSELLNRILLIVSFISIILVFVFIAFIFSKVNQARFKGSNLNAEISSLTQKLHHFRDLIDVLLRSKVWNPGLKEYIDEEFADLNYFQMKEFYKGRSKIALEFIEENNRYGETENLYLEAKSLLLNDPSKTRVEGYSNPRVYDKNILSKWVEHKCGSGLWYYFGYKYTNFKDELEVQRVYERHQDKITNLAIQIDAQKYQDMGFSEELLSKVGEQMSEDIIPRLHSLTMQSHKRLPKIVNAVYVLLLATTLLGVFLPLSTMLLKLNEFYAFLSISTVLSIFMFVVLGIYPYVIKEINRK